MAYHLANNRKTSFKETLPYCFCSLSLIRYYIPATVVDLRSNLRIEEHEEGIKKQDGEENEKDERRKEINDTNEKKRSRYNFTALL